jgi:hypothetical protein
LERGRFFKLASPIRPVVDAQSSKLELKLIQIQMTQKPMLLAEVHARAMRASQNVRRAEVWVGAMRLMGGRGMVESSLV